MPVSFVNFARCRQFLGSITLALAIGISATARGYGQTVDTTPTAAFVQNKGPKSNRVDLFLLGDGYTADQLSTTYTNHINNVLNNGFFKSTGVNANITNPYVRYQNFINIIRVDIKSVQSDIDVQNSSGTFTTTKDTALEGRQGHPVSQAIFINTTNANNAINTVGASLGYSLADADWRLLFANTSTYAGTATSSYPVFSAAWSNAPNIALHEAAHTNHNLEDEYSGSGAYTGGEPSRINVTANSAGAKWSQWLGFNAPATGVVGAYQGAFGYNTGIYRPSNNTLMRDVFGNTTFDPIAREKIILDIYGKVDPIDSHLATAPTYDVFDNLWLDVVDPNVINVQWKLGSSFIPNQTGELLDLSQIVSWLGPGSHTITARAYDTILDHNFSSNSSPDPLDLVRRNLNLLEQSLNFSVNIDWLPGDTNFDGDVDLDDFLLVKAALGNNTIIGDAANGDLNGDGLVNNFDLEILRARGIPEPSSLVLLAWGLIAIRRFRIQQG